MNTEQPSLVWFRNDLRLNDNAALWAAARRGPVLPVFIWDAEGHGEWKPGAASRWWLHHSLLALNKDLGELGSRLVLRQGDSRCELQKLVHETGAQLVYWNRRYEPSALKCDAEIRASLELQGGAVETFPGNLLFEPWTVQNRSGRPFQVFTPFWKTCLKITPAYQLSCAPTHLKAPSKWPRSLKISELELLSKIDWAAGIRAAWQPGEVGARNNVEVFLKEALTNYSENRDRPSLEGTSRLSPYLHFGEVSVREVWHRLHEICTTTEVPTGSVSDFLAELGWREFAHHLLYHFPHSPAEPLRAEFQKMRWREQPAWLKAWKRGETGYPIVDAGMRQLWTTGWMHNRVRMIAASFLVKDLLVSWQEGARWFWDTLVDADLANNTLGWQWTAGCGADASPFFRIFNPVTQGKKFDSTGAYVRKWIPELAHVPDRWIHQPYTAPPQVVAEAGVQLGTTYPKPLVPHGVARELALEAYSKVRNSS